MLKPDAPLAIRYSTPAPTIAPSTWAMTYGPTSEAGKRLATHRPAVTAGLRWQPEMWPMAKAIVSTVRPKASATPTSPIPMLIGELPSVTSTLAASTALPQPPNTSQDVPRNSAPSRFARGYGFTDFLLV